MAHEAAEAEPFDYESEFNRIMLCASVMADVRIEQLQETLERTHTVGMILDPTKYRNALFSGSLEQQEEMLRAARPFVVAARKIRAKAEAVR